MNKLSIYNIVASHLKQYTVNIRVLQYAVHGTCVKGIVRQGKNEQKSIINRSR